MKYAILASCLMLITSSSALANANVQEKNNATYRGNPIIVHNDTPHDIAYTISSQSIVKDSIYGIRAEHSDVYHTSTGDSRASIYVGICSVLAGNGLVCGKVEGSLLMNCVNYAHYDMNKVETIHVKSMNECTVRCIDGGTTSCLAP